MEQRLENSTLIALRELRSYEKERQLAERRQQDEEARLARERKEREQKAEEAAREQALEKQLRTDLQRAEEEICLLKQEADRRRREANHALQALHALASVPQAPTSPVSAALSARRGSWLVASGCTALLASALVLLLGVHRHTSIPAETFQRDRSCLEAVSPAPSPKTVAATPTTEVAGAQSSVSGVSESGRPRSPIPHPRTPGVPHPPRKPSLPKPICDGTDPLCGSPSIPLRLERSEAVRRRC